jgi:Pyruvate/2-oxoacid:ferredoxin oxidoreductase gamma subunit
MYVHHEGGGTMFIDASRPRAPIERTAMHELVHDLLRQTEKVPPLWIEEGLAEYFANAEISNGVVTAGQPIASHTAILRRRLPMTLPEMFAVQPETDAAMTPTFYAQSWGAVDWLMRLDPDAFFEFLQDVEEGRLDESELLDVNDDVRSLSSPVLMNLTGQQGGKYILESMIAHSDNTATDIALKHVGRALPNAALLGGFAAISGEIRLESVSAAIRDKFPAALAERNVAAAADAFAAAARAAEVPLHA